MKAGKQENGLWYVFVKPGWTWWSVLSMQQFCERGGWPGEQYRYMCRLPCEEPRMVEHYRFYGALEKGSNRPPHKLGRK